MRLIKLFGISFVVFFLLLTAFTSLIPGKVRISRAIDIAASKETVLPYLVDSTKWDGWNKWVTDAKSTIDKQLIQASDSLVTYTWAVGGKEVTSNWAVYELREGTTSLQWFFDIRVKWYPWEKLASIVYDQQMGPVMDESLAALKKQIESHP